ncbi:BCL2 modifying factor 2 [Sardina pilchardus]|uniref:BCL2 modifying factor 2 n=1 Tax=Sardina pilchardus TaxID=27697 RepID=UPI002E132802
MDDEEEDMFRPISRCWGTPFMDVKFEDRATQTNSSAVVPGRGSGMLPCRLAQESRPFFRGNAGLRWHFPALFEPARGLGVLEDEREAPRPEGGEVEERQVVVEGQELEEEDGPRLAQRPLRAGEEEEEEEDNEQEEARMSVEVQIGRKLREIGDNFNQEQLQMLARHQRDHLPLWWRVGAAVFGYLLQRVDVAPAARHGNPR